MTPRPSPESIRNPSWEPGHPEEFLRLSRRLRHRRQRRRFLQAATGALTAAVFGGGAWVWLGREADAPGDSRGAPLSCAEVQQRIQEYLRGGLAPSTREQIRIHLAGCPACQAMLSDMKGRA